MLKRAFLAALLFCALFTHPADALIRLGGGTSSGPAPTVLATYNIVNVGTSQQAANFITPSFGMGFKEGDIPSGTAPILADKATSAVLKYSWSCMSTTYALSNCAAWPDGSLKLAEFIARDPETIAAGANCTTASISNFTLTVSGCTGTISVGQQVFGSTVNSGTTVVSGSGSTWTISSQQTTPATGTEAMQFGTLQPIYVESGGTGPSGSSGRSLTDVYNQDIVISGTGLTGTGFGRLNGATKSAWVNGDSNTWKTTKFLDGDVGAGWEVWSHFASTEGGSADGQLETTNYVFALNDASNNLGGVRDLTRVHQPWYNPTSPSSEAWQAFSSLTWQASGVSSTSFLPSACNALFTAHAFTGNGTGVFTTTSANNYNQGAADFNMLPVTVSGASLPSALSASQLYWIMAGANSFSVTNFNIAARSEGGLPVSGGTSGSGTVTPVLTVEYFGQLWNAQSNGHYQYVQGTGSVATDAGTNGNVIVQYDPNYLRSTGIVPPWDSNVGPYPDNSFHNSTTGWSNTDCPYTNGQITTNTEATGDQPYIGPETNWAAVDSFNQSPGDDTYMHILGFVAGDWPFDIRDCYCSATATGEPFVLTSTSYTGMPASNKNAQWLPDSQSVTGFTYTNWDDIGIEQYPDTSHITEAAYYPYIKTGEPQYLDLLEERAVGGLMGSNPNNRNQTGTCAGQGISPAAPVQTRAVSWQTRDIGFAGYIAPAQAPDGSQLSKYLNDNAVAQFTFVACVFANGLEGAYAQTNGLFATGGSVNSDFYYGCCFFEYGYFDYVALQYAMLGKDANALSFLNEQATWLTHILSTFGGYAYTGEDSVLATDQNSNNQGTTVITNDNLYTINFHGPTTLAWNSTNTPKFTASGGTSITFSNGSSVMFQAFSAKPAGFSADTPYYMTNVSGLTFDLSATCATTISIAGSKCSAGGTPMTVTDSGSIPIDASDDNANWLPSDTSSGTSPFSAANGGGASGIGNATGYLTEILGVACGMNALGINMGTNSNLATVIGDAYTRNVAAGVTNALIAAYPKFTLQGSLGAPISGTCP